jgi:N-acetyl-gamma-glutamyl-phosphate reductase
MKTAVLGATGYTGLILLRLLAEHPDVTDILPVSSSHAGQSVRSVDPGLAPAIERKLKLSDGKLLTMAQAVQAVEGPGIDAVFAGLPHLKSAELCAPFIGRSVVIDLSADFRFRDPEAFARAYGAPHPKPELLDKAVYGLAEWHRNAIKNADLIAQPGCYPTATLLPLLPLAREGLLKGTVIANAISGISGAGKKERMDLLYCERTENAGAYNPGKVHRHAPEIEKELKAAAPSLDLLFTPHLAPIKRGMAVTTVVELAKDLPESGAGSVESVYQIYYGSAPFICLAAAGRIPQTREVWGSNRCDIGWHREGRYLILFSAIDNLVKGASGNALQCMNIRFGLDETAGLRAYGEL